MSYEMEAYSDDQPTVDDEAYEPTYTEAFPPLPSHGDESLDQLPDSPAGQTGSSQWNWNSNSNLSIRSSVITQVTLSLFWNFKIMYSL